MKGVPAVTILLQLLLVSSVDGTEKKDYENKYGKGEGVASIFSMEYLPIGHLRTDPVISQSCLSNHVHTFYGPPKIHPSVTFEELRSTSDTTPHGATSGNLLENQSLYWHPTFYRVQDDGTREIMEPDWTTVYYAFNKGETKAFPEGFRMIGGPPDGLKLTCYSKQYAEYKDVGKKIVYNGTAYPDTDKDTSYNDTDKYTDKYGTTNQDENHFPSDSCEELAASLVFPTCWDGVNLDSDSHRSHVAYAMGLESASLGTFGGSDFYCPDSHPILLPQIQLFLRFVNYSGGAHELSNGDGGDWHADYIMGWEESVLQDILDDVDCDVVKDIPCGATRLRDIHGTGTAKSGGEPSWVEMSKTLRQVRVPIANTMCITDESVDKIKMPPRGGCAGNIFSVDSCQQPKFPVELLSSKVDNDVSISKNGNEKFTGDPRGTAFAVLVGSVLSAVLSVV